MKSYSELMTIESYADRLDYLRINGLVGEETFGMDRYINQAFYNSHMWRTLRTEIISRDMGFDMGHPDFPIDGKLIVHHINPITIDEVVDFDYRVIDPENLITVSDDTHRLIHYGIENESEVYTPREKDDHILWK